jgi:hypothetical protein
MTCRRLLMRSVHPIAAVMSGACIFHVPIYLESFGLLRTTRDDIVECMRLLKDSEVKHWEVETYSWNVLPPELQVNDLAEGIAKEFDLGAADRAEHSRIWVNAAIAACRFARSPARCRSNEAAFTSTLRTLAELGRISKPPHDLYKRAHRLCCRRVRARTIAASTRFLDESDRGLGCHRQLYIAGMVLQ